MRSAATFASALGLALVLCGCPPTPPPAPINANVAFPTPLPIPQMSFWSENPSLALIESNPQRGLKNRIVAGFSDSSGLYEHSPDFFLVLKNPATADGVAISDDFGATWSRPDPWILPPENEVLLGFPSVASNQEQIVYASLAALSTTDVTHAPSPTRVDAMFSDDGEGWSIPDDVIVHDNRGEAVIGCSASFVGSTAVVIDTWSKAGEAQDVDITTSDDAKFFSTPPQTLTLEATGISRAIVKLASPTAGYLAYTTFSDGATRHLYVASLHRDAGTTTWTTRTLLSTTYEINVTVPIKPASTSEPAISWFDANPISFDIGNVNATAGTARLHLAFRTILPGTGKSVVQLVWCEDAFTPDEACAAPAAWNLASGLGTVAPFLGQFQPVVAANRLNSDVAISYYEDVGSTGGGVRLLTTFGKVATDPTEHLSTPTELDPRHWAACPAAESQHDYGSYLGSLIPPGFHQPGVTPTIVTLYVNSSGGCDPTYGLPVITPTYDHHVESSQW